MSTTYSTGTVSVGASSTSLTGAGTAWLTSGVQAGDLLLLAGMSVRIASVDSNTAITLARGWPGAMQSGANYDILLLDDNVRTLTAANALLQTLSNGTLTSLAGQAGSANKLPYFSGSNTFSLANLTAAARAILGLAGSSGAKIPVVTGTGTAQMRDVLGTVAQASGVPSGALVERGSNANGEYARWADGTQIAVKRFTGLGPVVTSEGALYRTVQIPIGSFAASFAVAPYLALRTGQNSGDRTWGVMSFLKSDPGYTPGENGAFFVYSATSNAATTLGAEIIAIGRWF